MANPRAINRRQYYQNRRRRNRFIFLVYCLTIVFIVLTVLQWIIVIIFCDIGTVLTNLFWLGPLLLIVGLILMCLFIFFKKLRSIFLLNWIIAIIIVECVTWGSARTIAEATSAEFGIAFVISLILIILFIIIGSFIKYDLTLNVVVLLALAIIFLVGTVFSTALLLITRINYTLYIYCIFIISIILMSVMFQSQTINGGRFANTPISENLLPTLIVYLTFVMSFLVIYIMLAKDTKRPFSSWHCDTDDNSADNTTEYTNEFATGKPVGMPIFETEFVTRKPVGVPIFETEFVTRGQVGMPTIEIE